MQGRTLFLPRRTVQHQHLEPLRSLIHGATLLI
jgi:hypothetical protein